MRYVPILLLLAASAAIAAPPAPPTIIGTRDLGAVETSAIISGRDGAYSTRVNGVTVWVYGDTALTSPGADGGNWRHNTLSWSRDLWAPDAVTGFSDWADTIGAPIQFIPLTQAELDYNAAHHGDNCQVQPCNYEYGHWPGTLLFDADRQRILYTYAKMLLGPGAWNFTSEGTGIAVGSTRPGADVVRPNVSPGAADPTLLFGPGEPGFINASFVATEGGVTYAYFYDCSGGSSGFDKPMHVAKVPLAQALDRSAWRFYSTDGTWSPDDTNMARIFDGSDQLSVQWSPFLGRYLAVYVGVLSQNVYARVADHPEGPWSDPALLFVALPPVSGGLDYCGMTHLELERDGGRYEYVTYVRDTGPFQAERHMVEVEFARRIESDDRDAVYDPTSGVSYSDTQNAQQLCMGNAQSLWRQMGVEFPLNVPHDATITDATVQLVSSGQNGGGYTPVVRAIAEDDVAPFVAGSTVAFTDAYPLTAAGAPWTPDATPAGTPVDTSDLHALVQEVVDRPGWTSGNHLGFVFPETRKGNNIRCFEDSTFVGGQAAALRVGYYAHGTPVCLDASAGEDALRLSRAPASGCAATTGPAREFVFGRLGALRVANGTVDLGPVRCAGGAGSTTDQVVLAEDPDQPAGDGSIYLVRAAGAPDFGNGKLGDGSTPARNGAASFCP